VVRKLDSKFTQPHAARESRAQSVLVPRLRPRPEESEDGAATSLSPTHRRCSMGSTSGCDDGFDRCAGRSGSARRHGHATLGASASSGRKPTNGASVAKAPGVSEVRHLCSVPCRTLTGAPSASLGSVILMVASGKSGEPPDADPHVRWCGRGGLDTRPYPICERGSLTQAYRVYMVPIPGILEEA
jgi:hypothetical protein